MIIRILSGGQSGTDRAAMDTTISLGIYHAAYCPAGRQPEDGRIPDKYNLTETKESKPEYRTEKNVIHSDASLILYDLEMDKGSFFTFQQCKKHKKALLTLDFSKTEQDLPLFFQHWIQNNEISDSMLQAR